MNAPRRGRSCNTCRARKIGCDEKRPACSQCLLTGRECSGYYREIVFVDRQKKPLGAPVTRSGQLGSKAGANTAGPKPRTTGRKMKPWAPAIKYSISDQPCAGNVQVNAATATVLDYFTPDHQISLVSRYGDQSLDTSRVCGAWVSVLPMLVARSLDQTDILITTLKALSTAIISRMTENCKLLTQSRRLYSDALKSLHDELCRSAVSCPSITLATSMCLGLTELMLGTSSLGWTSHTQGVAKSMEMHGPDQYVSGINHQLFLGFRVFLLLDAIQARKPTFMNEPSWRSIPFSVSSTLSPLQELITHTSVLPSLLERLDNLSTESCEDPIAEARDILLELHTLLDTLDGWETSFSKNEGPVSWPVLVKLHELDLNSDKEIEEEAVFPTSIYFPNITFANTMTHYWSFIIDIILAIQSTNTFLTTLCIDEPLATSPYSVESLEQWKFDMAAKICQSMEYLMQKKMKLYGPASTFYPLSVAKRIYIDSGPDRQRELIWCNKLVGLLIKRGLILAEYINTRR